MDDFNFLFDNFYKINSKIPMNLQEDRRTIEYYLLEYKFPLIAVNIKETVTKEKRFLFFKKKKSMYTFEVILKENEYIAHLLSGNLSIEELFFLIPTLFTKNNKFVHANEVTEVIYRNGEMRSEPRKFQIRQK